MPNFKSESAFHTFSSTVRRTYRFAHSPECMEFLNAVKISAKDRVLRLRQGHPLWRAAIGHIWDKQNLSSGSDDVEDVEIDVPAPFDQDRMSPDPMHVQAGRLNPRAIAYLYLSTEPDTAIAEVP